MIKGQLTTFYHLLWVHHFTLLKGDSGGPVTCVQNGQPVVTGITSYAMSESDEDEGCAEEGHPGIYVNVYNYLDWIYEKTGSDLGES